jgi:RhoGAP domain/RasGEF domain/RasGEF N-terminal motif/Pleckstrin homology domain
VNINRNDAGQPRNRWNADLDVPLESVQLSRGTTEVDKKSSEEGRAGVIEPIETEDLASRSILKSTKSAVSLSSHIVELDISPPGHTATLSRHFVPTSTDAGSRWTECFTHAKFRIDQHPSAARTSPPLGTPHEPGSQRANSNSGPPVDAISPLILKEYRIPAEYFDYRDIQGGSVDELFNELLRVRKDYLETGYVEFVRAFLLTYPLFTTSAELISALKKGLIAFASDKEAGQWAMRRAYQITQIWCNDFKADVVGEVATGLLGILDMDLWKSECDETPHITLDSIADLKKIVLAAVDDNAKTYETSVSLESEAVTYDVKINTVIKGSELHYNKGNLSRTVDVSDILNVGLTPTLLLKIDPAEFAKQIYLFHQSSYRIYKQRLLNPLCYIPQSLPSTTAPSHLLFTTSSPHFLTSFVNQHILIDSHQMCSSQLDELVLRAMLIEHWIRVGEELFALGDMCGWCSIAVSICSFAILRLRQSWKFVNQDLIERVINIWSPILIQSNMFSTEIGSSGWQTYSTLGKLYVLDPTLTGITLPNAHMDHFTRTSSGLPFFGVIRQFVERLRRHVQRYLETPTNTNNHQHPIVNFEKYWSIYDAIWTSLQRYQSLSQDDTVESLAIEPIGPIQAFFEHTQINLLSVPNDYNVLQECSLECEPKPFVLGSSIRSPRKLKWINESIAPPSSWILSFPQLVSSINKKDTLSGIIQPTTVRSMKIFQQQLPTTKTSRLKKLAMPDTIPETEGSEKGNEARSPSTSSMQESSRGSRNRKRTYSFPSSRSISELGLDSSLTAVENMESNSRSWINAENYKKSQAGAKSPFHAIGHIGAVGEKLLSVRDGELILQIDDLKENKPSFVATKPLFNIISASYLFGSKPVPDISVRWTEDQGQGSAADGKIKTQKVKVKAGTYERLMDVLIHGLSEYSANVDSQDDFGEYVFSECRLSVDMEEYVHVFFVTYRSFLSDTELLEYLRKSFVNASSIGRITKLRQKYSLKSMFETSFDSDKPSEEADIKDWRCIARVRLQILDLIIYWVGHFFWDFTDESANRKKTSQLVEQMIKSTEDMRLQVGELMEESIEINDEAESVFELIDTMELKILYLNTILFISFLTPSLSHRAIGDIQSSNIDKCKVVEKYSTYVAQTKEDIKTGSSSPVQSPYMSSKPGSTTSTQPQPVAPKRPIPSVLAQLAATDILQQVDSIVQQIFTDTTLQDWILLNDSLVTQSIDPYSWLPVRKNVGSSGSSHMMMPPYTEQIGMNNIADDEILISDIFIAIQGARRSTLVSTSSTTDNLMASLPDAIQQLFNLHFSIRSWIINELTSYTIDADQRAERMQKCIDVIVLSRLQMATEPIFKELLNNPEQLDPLSNGGKVIPGFVEYSILSALVSPQIRLFVKSWTKTAEKNQGQNLDTPEVIIDAAVTIAQLTKSQAKSTRSRPYVISIGWVIEMMLELGEGRTETIRNSEPLVKFDQCQYCYNFWRFISQVKELVKEDNGMRMSESGDFTEKLRESLAPRLMDFLTAPTQPWPALSLKALREFAGRENATMEKNKALSVSQAPLKLVSNSNHGASTISNKSLVFGKLVAKQQEKLKADTKERERIDREWREIQHKMQKKQLEQAKTIEKRERKLLKHHGSSHQHQSSHLPWINSFLRGLKITHTNEQHQELGGMSKDDYHLSDVLTVPVVTDNMKASNVINLINSTSSVASTYLKRDFVFRIVTEEGGQYLFQAMNDSNMHDWIRTINWAAKEGAARRLTVLVAQAENKRKSGTSDDLKFFDDRQRKKGKEVRGSIYGVDLSELMSSGKIPFVVENCIDEIERRGLEEVGIYRVAGSGETVSYLRQQLNRNAGNVNLSDDDWIDINVVADALKQFFRDLPQPLLTFDLYGDFMKASGKLDKLLMGSVFE